MNIHFVLVEPVLPENVGACARAIKTMGFQYLHLVKGIDPRQERARWLAHGSGDILDSAQIHQDLSSAIGKMDLTIGTTSKHRNLKNKFYTPEETARLVNNKKETLEHVGIIFGREDKGLTNDELKQCDVLSSIPLNRPFPSLNLSHAVMIYAYTLSNIQLLKGPSSSVHPGEFPELKNKVSQILETLNIKDSSNAYQIIMGRLANLEIKDMKILHFICNQLQDHLEYRKQ